MRKTGKLEMRIPVTIVLSGLLCVKLSIRAPGGWGGVGVAVEPRASQLGEGHSEPPTPSPTAGAAASS